MSLANLTPNSIIVSLSDSGGGRNQCKMLRSWEMVESAVSEKPGSLNVYLEQSPSPHLRLKTVRIKSKLCQATALEVVCYSN